jgi:ubiquinone/menaquinone biosynthesis C-methylase UbiE
MLTRILEPEAMDTVQEARDYDAMDHSVVNARFVADFLAAHGGCRGGAWLDVGTGPGQIPILLCQADAQAHVVGIDLSAAMLELARSHVREAGLDHRIVCVQGDAKNLPLATGYWEAVVSNSIIHHIPDPAPALAGMTRLVQPGGTVMVRDLARPATDAEVARLVALYAGDASPGARDLYEASLHAALTLDEVRAILKMLGLPPEGAAMTSDRHWTWLWRRPT